MMQILFVFMTLCTFNVYAFLSYDTAASLMQQGRWQEAKQQLQTLLIDKPDTPDVLYDAGVASYKTKDYKQARAYFNRATQLPQTKISLKEQAHFNAGNAAAALKDYEDAIKHYEMVLNINSRNEKAKHNIEQIKQLMQRKQEQQKQNDSKESKDDKEQKEENSSDDAQKQMDDTKKKEHEKGNGNNEAEKSKSQDQNKQEEQDQGNQEQQGSQANQGDSREDSQRNQREQADKGKQEQEQHKTSPDQQKDTKQPTQGTGGPEKDQGQAGEGHENQNNLKERLDERLIQVLDAQEKRDAALNKRMINSAVEQSMGGSQGENCW